MGRFGRKNMLRPYLKIWDWDLIFGREVKSISWLGVRSPWVVWLGCPLQYWKRWHYKWFCLIEGKSYQNNQKRTEINQISIKTLIDCEGQNLRKTKWLWMIICMIIEISINERYWWAFLDSHCIFQTFKLVYKCLEINVFWNVW